MTLFSSRQEDQTDRSLNSRNNTWSVGRSFSLLLKYNVPRIIYNFSKRSAHFHRQAPHRHPNVQQQRNSELRRQPSAISAVYAEESLEALARPPRTGWWYGEYCVATYSFRIKQCSTLLAAAAVLLRKVVESPASAAQYCAPTAGSLGWAKLGGRAGTRG